MSAEIRTGRLGRRLLLSGSIKNGDSHTCLRGLAGDAWNGGRHPGEPDHHLSAGAAWLPDSQADSPCISETRRQVTGTVWGMVGVGMEGLRETKRKETRPLGTLSLWGKVQSRSHSGEYLQTQT